MCKFRIALGLLVCMTAPAWALFTDNFEANPFGAGGNWSRSGDVTWTGGGAGNDYVNVGLLGGNDDNWLWRSFTPTETGNYTVSFDYRFTGLDIVSKNDTVSAQIGIASTPTFDVFDASSSVDLTALLGGDWQTITTPPPVITLNAGQEYWLAFRLNEATGLFSPITSLDIDNVYVGTPSNSTSVPAPGAVLLGSIGVAFVGWLKRRRTL